MHSCWVHFGVEQMKLYSSVHSSLSIENVYSPRNRIISNITCKIKTEKLKQKKVKNCFISLFETEKHFKSTSNIKYGKLVSIAKKPRLNEENLIVLFVCFPNAKILIRMSISAPMETYITLLKQLPPFAEYKWSKLLGFQALNSLWIEPIFVTSSKTFLYI